MIKRRFKEGEKVTYKNAGYGLVTFETDEAVGVRKGKLFTRCFDSQGMEWSESRKTWVFDGVMGLVCSRVANDDPEAVKFLANEAKS